MNNHYDIAIVGAGIVGLTLANALANTGLKLLVIERNPLLSQAALPEYPLRVSAINPRSQRIFQDLGCWQSMEQMRVSPFRQMQVWDSEGQGQIHFDSADMGMASLGHIIENDVMIMALLQRVKQHQQVTLLAPCELQQITMDATAAHLVGTTSEWQADLLVAADGANSWVRQQLAVPLQTKAYDHKAIVATVKTEQPHQLTAWQRFLPTGPLAFLPLKDPHTCSIVWSLVPEKADYLMSLADEPFAQALTTAFADTLGSVTAVGSRACFPLLMRHAAYYTQDRLALVGDAAHTIHPLAGQGVNLGIADAAQLAQVVGQALVNKQSFAKHLVLRRYERARKGENQLMIHTMAGFKHLFGSQSKMTKILRNQGLNLANRLTPLKHFIMQQAMGS